MSAASGLEREFLDDAVDLDRYPVHQRGSDAYRRCVEAIRADLADTGCCVLAGFLRESAVAELARQSESLKDHAHHRTIHTNPYSSPDDENLPEGHPVRTFLERNNAFVAADFIPASSHVRRLYDSDAFRRFVADCLGEDEIFEYSDPYAKLVLNVLSPGTQHPWHYDTNEFIVSTLLAPAGEGGEFQYCPQIRTPQSENYDDVAAVLHDQDHSRVRRLSLSSGDLQLFYGRHSLHRVTRVGGDRDRITAIFAYAKKPGIIGRVERTKRLFGRVSDEHRKAERHRDRADSLRD